MDRDEHLSEPVIALVVPVSVHNAPSPTEREAPSTLPTLPADVSGSPAMHATLSGDSTRHDAGAWEVVANLALTVTCGLAIVLVLGLTIGPRFLAYETFIVRSGSMAPTIHTGALVIVQPVQPRDVKAGDVITSIDGDRVRSSSELSGELRDKDGAVSIGIIRDKKESTVQATLESATTRRR